MASTGEGAQATEIVGEVNASAGPDNDAGETALESVTAFDRNHEVLI